MKKTTCSIFVSIALIVSLLVGCGSSSVTDNKSNYTEEGQQTQTDLDSNDASRQESADSELCESESALSSDTINPSGSGKHSSSSSSSATDAGQIETKRSIETPVNIDLNIIPDYSGDAYISINNNTPYFSTEAFPDAGEEYYATLDSLGRCVVAYATTGKETMPTAERGSIGMVKPTGWHTVKYDCVDGKYLYNRCHLIGYQLTAENANTSNLITGTRYLNIQGMLPFENMTADYIKETGNHVAYRVTPVFDGDNLVASGVVMEGYSIEDAGKGVCFCVFAYNVQPGVIIDYATGDSELAQQSTNQSGTQTTGSSSDVKTPSKSEKTQPDNMSEITQSQPSNESEQTYILNINTKKFHYPHCSSVGQMKESNKQEYTGSRDSIISQGYVPCKKCNP